MQRDVMKHFGLTRGLPRAGYFETEAQRRVFNDIKAAVSSWPWSGGSAAARRPPCTA
jgi:hypothetical protein